MYSKKWMMPRLSKRRSDRLIERRTEVKARRSLEIRDLIETVTKEEVITPLCEKQDKFCLQEHCRHYNCFGGVRDAVV